METATRGLLRQGDVLLVPVSSRPGTFKEVPRDAGRVVLAYGEVTGHAHAILDERARLFTDLRDSDRRFLEITAGLGDLAALPAQLEHEEHATITVAPGHYEVRRQREHWPEQDRLVAD